MKRCSTMLIGDLGEAKDMTKSQFELRMLILADLKLAIQGANSDNKYEKLLGAYHAQQAIEKL